MSETLPAVPANKMLLDMPALEDLGPAMRALSERQRKFVIAYFHTGQREPAYRMAGYATTNDNLTGTGAYRVFHTPKVQEALREFGRDTALGALIPQAFKAIEEALTMGDTKEKTKAAGMVLDRTGFHATMEHRVTKVTESREDTIRTILRFAREQGLDPKTLIGGAADFTDADFEVVERAEGAKKVDAEVSFEGLEGLV